MSLYTPGRRANGTNPRARCRNKYAVKAWKRKRRELGLKRPDPLLTMDEMKALKVKRAQIEPPGRHQAAIARAADEPAVAERYHQQP